MRIPALTASFALALALAACGGGNQADEVTTDANIANDALADGALGNEAVDNAAMPTDAAGFATAVAASDMYEIESGKLAAEKATSADLKSFGQKLQADHAKSTADLKAAASQANVTVTPALDAEKQAMLDRLRAASGAEFDRLFVEQQTTAHQKALALLQNYATGGDTPALKDFATKAASVVQAHLDQVSGMNRQ